MRKLIDIPDEIVEDLQIKAVKAKTNPKNYIESLVVNDVRGKKENKKEEQPNDGKPI